MEIEQTKAIIEAILFAAGRPVTENELMLNLELSKDDIKQIIENEYAADIYADVMSLNQDNIIRFTFSEPYGYCVLIDYGNEYYCIISQEGSGVINYDIKYDNYIFSYSKIGFDKEGFETFIKKYK